MAERGFVVTDSFAMMRAARAIPVILQRMMRIVGCSTNLPAPDTRLRLSTLAPVGRAHRLVAAKVRQAVSFDQIAQSPSVPASSSALQMYTRAADRIEAAVGVHIGRQIDVVG